MKTNTDFFFNHISLSSTENEKFFKQSCRENQNTFYVQ